MPKPVLFHHCTFALELNCIIECALNVMKSIKAFLKQDYAAGITVILLEQMGRSWHEAARASSQAECAGIPVQDSGRR